MFGGEVMASKKPTMILLSKTDITKEEVAELSDTEAWALIYSMRTRKAKDTRLQVCFTGFGYSEKKKLNDIASSRHFRVVSSVTRDLDFLCCGENAGPKKIERAEAQGVQILSKEQFVRLIETGEVPSAT
jgi:NAD-dependent DNA ligase